MAFRGDVPWLFGLLVLFIWRALLGSVGSVMWGFEFRISMGTTDSAYFHAWHEIKISNTPIPRPVISFQRPGATLLSIVVSSVRRNVWEETFDYTHSSSSMPVD